jgi:hypothetical protein
MLRGMPGKYVNCQTSRFLILRVSVSWRGGGGGGERGYRQILGIALSHFHCFLSCISSLQQSSKQTFSIITKCIFQVCIFSLSFNIFPATPPPPQIIIEIRIKKVQKLKQGMKKSGIFRYIRIASFRTVSCWRPSNPLSVSVNR